MGRNGKSAALHIAEGNPNRLTKDELKRRQENEVKLGKADLKNLQAPDYVKLDLIAFDKWKTLIKMYKDAAINGFELLTTSDIETLGKYCVTYSEYLSLISRRKRIDTIDFVSLRDDARKIRGDKRKSMNEVARLEHVVKIETAINKKHEIMIKLEDRLFLNPLAKIKNVPRKDRPKTKNPMEERFRNL